MTIQSWGYAGTAGPNDVWANLQWVFGCQYTVRYATDAVVEPVVGGTRQVQVGTGMIGGWGILDQITDAETVQLDPVVSGIHYWLVVARRTWQTTQETSIAVIDCSTTLPSAMPSTRNAQPGTIDDQPLALVSIAAGDTDPKIVYDLRAFGGPDSYSMSADLAGKPNWFAHMARQGVQIRCGNTTYTRVIDENTLNPVWDVDPTIVRSGPGLGDGLNMVGVPGWTAKNDVESRGVRTGNRMELLLQAVHDTNSNSIDFSTAKGATNDTTILTIGNSDWHPPFNIPGVGIEYLDSDGASYGGTARYTTDGELIIISGAPATSVGVRTNGTWSVRALVSWNREA